MLLSAPFICTQVDAAGLNRKRPGCQDCKTLVLPCGNNGKFSARYLCQGKEKEGGGTVDTPADDDAALAQRTGVEFTGIPAR